jgi:hypothetical protein
VRKATRKDVLFALEYGHERLIKTIVVGARTPDQWSLSESGAEVEAKMARELVNDPHIVALEDGLFPGMSQQFEWRSEAA